jgi:chromosome segregation ATPase
VQPLAPQQTCLDQRKQIYERIDGILEDAKQEIGDKQSFRSLLLQEQQSLDQLSQALDKENRHVKRKVLRAESELSQGREEQTLLEADLGQVRGHLHFLRSQLSSLQILANGDCQ